MNKYQRISDKILKEYAITLQDFMSSVCSLIILQNKLKTVVVKKSLSQHSTGEYNNKLTEQK